MVSRPLLSHLECSPSTVGSWLASQVTGGALDPGGRKSPHPCSQGHSLQPCGTLLAAMWVMAPLPLRSEACLDHGGHALSQTICVHYLVLCRELPQTQRLDTTIDVFHTVSVGQECGPWSWMVLPGRELWLGRSHCVGRARFLHSPWGWQAGAGC